MLHDRKLSGETFDLRIDDPFLVFEIADILDPKDFDELDRTFPSKSIFPRAYVDRGNKSFLDNQRPEFFAFLKTSPLWNSFYRKFFDPEIVQRFYSIASMVPSERPTHQNLRWKVVFSPDRVRTRTGKPIQNLLARLRGYTAAEVGFEFSYLENGCFIPPHTDNAKKLISLMVYFPDKGVAYKDAGTDFYRGKRGSPTWQAWKAGMLPDKEAGEFYAVHEPFHSSQFEGNKLVGFVKSSVSWHGLKRLTLPPGAMRRSVNINYYAL
jgi:hypothetical protein